ncbi:hypothetical protein [Thalassotalea fusca]
MNIFKTIKIKGIAKKYRINFNSRMGLSVNGLLVSDFEYLLSWYSKNKLSSFSDRELLYFHHESIFHEINVDLKNDNLKEEIAYPVSVNRNLAKSKIIDFKLIVSTLVTYYLAEVR